MYTNYMAAVQIRQVSSPHFKKVNRRCFIADILHSFPFHQLSPQKLYKGSYLMLERKILLLISRFRLFLANGYLILTLILILIHLCSEMNLVIVYAIYYLVYHIPRWSPSQVLQCVHILQ